jgi:hypothetical protein
VVAIARLWGRTGLLVGTVIGVDLSAPDGRSYWVWNPGGCTPQEQSTTEDYLIWSCVTSCGGIPVEGRSWGQVKSLYR